MEKKIYTVTLNRAAKLLERLAVLRAEANSNVNLVLTGVKIDAATADTAEARLGVISSELQLNIDKTLAMIALHQTIRNQIMVENARLGITELLAKLEAASGQTKFLDHTISVLTSRSRLAGISGADVPKLDEAAAPLKKMIDFRKSVDDLVQNLPQDDDKARIRLAISHMQYNSVTILPVSTHQLKVLEETRTALRRSINSLHDQLSAANANKIDIEFPVYIALDLGLTA